MLVASLGQEDSLEKETAPHSSISARRIPWMEESEGLQCIALQRVRHDCSDLARMHAKGKFSERKKDGF